MPDAREEGAMRHSLYGDISVGSISADRPASVRYSRSVFPAYAFTHRIRRQSMAWFGHSSNDAYSVSNIFDFRKGDRS